MRVGRPLFSEEQIKPLGQVEAFEREPAKASVEALGARFGLGVPKLGKQKFFDGKKTSKTDGRSR